MNPSLKDLAGIVKAHSDAYLAAYDAGYTEGMKAGIAQALKVITKPEKPKPDEAFEPGGSWI